MRNECLNHRYVYESPMPLGRLVRQVADKAQVGTQRSWKRPYGVGLIVAGVDESGPHVFYSCPSGNYYDYKAFAMGARSQAAKTYLERQFEGFAAASLDELVSHALHALQASLQVRSAALCPIADPPLMLPGNVCVCACLAVGVLCAGWGGWGDLVVLQGAEGAGGMCVWQLAGGRTQMDKARLTNAQVGRARLLSSP
jgi:hypothetical protein